MDKKLTPLSIAIIVASVIVYLGSNQSSAIAQSGPSLQSGDALWHLPSFSKDGWFLHASNGKVRACNMDKVSIVGDRPGPRCSNWE